MPTTLRALSVVISVLLLIAACAPAAAPAVPKPERIVIAVQPTSTPEQLTADANELGQFLGAKLARPVDLVFPTTYAGVVEAMRFGHAHAAFMGAWPASLAQKHAGAEVVLAEVREVLIGETKAEAPYYFSYWVVRKDSPITNVEQLRGKRVSLPSPLSTSGYVAPIARLVELGLLPATGKELDAKAFFGDVVFSGGYGQSWEALKSGQVDAIVIAGDVAESLYRDVLANTRIIERQGPIPSHAVMFAKQLEEPTRTQLKNALMELGQPEQRALMRKLVSGIFVSFQPTTTDEHLASLNQYLKVTQVAFVERMK
ncbi:MAG: phosphate/phosphite/phosphonate ABC transporter substrate-binding protein [Chloroflexi bacterium]|nr:phosphate/phosphite/phosphonate ABC transporter substrate-binding protein [Chloroflexota bacterium]